MHQFDCKCKCIAFMLTLTFSIEQPIFLRSSSFVKRSAIILFYAFENLKKQYRYKVKHLRVVAKHTIA